VLGFDKTDKLIDRKDWWNDNIIRPIRLTEADYLGAAESAGLSDVHIVDRLIYDGAMIATLIADQLPVAIADLADRMGFSDEGTLMDFVIEQLDGKIESVKLTATLQ
jgi:hypothetical protein